ncbi:hypothetical protein HDV05_006956 [Chytridiales sp. JEL 0842]|nr:hypothetical protein HDV05_006956 [Chytridiales sp. JEL 0842]
MPKYYCDYCDIFLTHDSPSVRKAHNAGWKHKMHVQNYFQGLSEEKIQEIQKILTKAYEGLPNAPDFSNAPPNPFAAMGMMMRPPMMIPGMPGMPPMPGVTKRIKLDA